MEAGALLAALILVTPAKWEKKVIAQITNFLMMHIGNTFRVAFHFWFTTYLHEQVGLSEADAFLYAHDYLSKVFGFIGIIIFTLVIERIGVKIVSTFGAWLDAIGEGIKRSYWKIRDSAFYLSPISAAVVAEAPDNDFEDLALDSNNPSTQTIDSKVAITVKHSEKVFFYPLKEIKNERWSTFLRTFGIFIAVSGLLLLFGLIPGLSKVIAQASDYIASSWFGAEFTGLAKVNAFWYTSTYSGTTYYLTTSIFRSGLGIAAFIIGLIFATPATWRNRITAALVTIVIVFPMNILRLGIQKWAIWSLANNEAMKDTRTSLYVNLASLATDWIPVIYFVIVFSLLIFICHKLEVKVLSSIYAWMHQIYYWGAGRLGIRDEPEEESKESRLYNK
jgi:exosortase/archaeosortase family protein